MFRSLTLTLAFAVAALGSHAQRPEMVGRGVVSTNDVFGNALTPDGSQLIFVKAANQRATLELWTATWDGKQWSGAARLPWTLDGDIDPSVSPDGKTLLFNRRRLLPDGSRQVDIWQANWDLATNTWVNPQPIPGPVNTDTSEVYPSVDADGNLYFQSSRPGDYGQYDLFVARKTATGYAEPENLGPVVNSEQFEGNPFVGSNGRYIIFWRADVRDRLTPSRLYITYRRNGEWTTPEEVKLKAPTGGSLFCPMVDERRGWLYFSEVLWPNEGPRKPIHENVYRVRLSSLGLDLKTMGLE